MTVTETLDTERAELTEWRRTLHAQPELAFNEHKTAAFVAQKLESWGIEVQRGIAKTGVVGTLRVGASTRSVGLRADMDALAMPELNSFAHRSLHDGCFHGCGHDGHTVMLLAAARYLSRTRHFDGTVHFIFQPAEEGSGGGRVMVEEGLFDRFPCDEIYAMHNWPLLPLGRVALRAGPMMAATDHWDLVIRGVGGHAAFPEQTVDPIFVATQIVQAWQGLISRSVSPTAPAVLSTTCFNAGTAYNVIPDSAVLKGTVRTLDAGLRDTLETRMAEVAKGLAEAWRATAEFTYVRGYPPSVNDATCVNHAHAAARRIFAEADILTDLPPSMGGEDFAYMLESRPGAYIWLGQGSSAHHAGLHSPRYDFNDEALPLGASLHVALAESRLQPNVLRS